MPRISVVVPVYNVEAYLDECLESIARQTFADLEVIMVDDGSADGSAAIAQGWADRDPRFRLIAQPNAGLGAARNAGADAATGEFLAFVDSDDVLPLSAYQRLVAALDETGSDYAAGNVHRLTRHATVQAPFLARVFRETQLATHVTRFHQMVVDRIVPNKLWRRSFWDEHGLRFPEGMLHEDIPVVLPAMFLARSVDLIADLVYLYRIREGEDRSITQRRAEPKALLDRIAAVQHVSEFLAGHAPGEFKERYDASVVREDLRYYLNVLDIADDEYRELFLDRVNAFLDGVDPKAFATLKAIERLKWHLVRRRLMPELLEVLRFQREELAETPPVREDGHWYGRYPYRGDARLAVPDEIYRVDGELKPAVDIEDVRWEGDELVVDGWAFVGGIGAPAQGSQKVEVSALRPGRLTRLRLVVAALRFRTREVHRPDVTALPRKQLADLSWAGFSARLPAARLRRAGRWRTGSWRLYVTVRAGGLKRRRSEFWVDLPRAFPAADLAAGDVRVTAACTRDGGIAVDVRDTWAEVQGHEADGDVVNLAGKLRMTFPADAKPALQLTRDDGRVRRRRRFAVGEDGRSFTARVPLAELVTDSAEEHADDEEHPAVGVGWTLEVAGGPERLPLLLPRAAGEHLWHAGGAEIALTRTRQGTAALVVRRPAPVVTAARWDDDVLVVSGTAAEGPDELMLMAPSGGDRHAFPLGRDGRNGHFEARLAPARVPTLGGELPLRAATWELMARPAGTLDDDEAVPVSIAEALAPALPARAVTDRKPFALSRAPDGRALLVVHRDVAPEERGAFNQRLLRRSAYKGRRAEPLRDAVVYSSFGGRSCSDSPRAIHDELVRRGAPLEHLWVVGDGACRVPPTATVLREGSREHLEAMARARYVVANDHFPDWFRRRDDQVCLQTWHGAPLKHLGFDAAARSRAERRFERLWEDQHGNWQYVLSPSAFATPIMRSAYRLDGEILETGYPRNDLLARPDRDELERRVRERLGLAPGARTVLYAPTFRDDVTDRRGRYRLDLRLELDRLRGTLGPQTVVLFRKHHYIIDPVPETPDGFVRDVSAYPDAIELLLAADVLVTDYSSLVFDYANTGRPMLLYTYDLEDYAERVRGLYLDLAAVAPGPLLRSTDEVAEALRDLAGTRARYADRYAAFAGRFCALDDGRATARVVDRVFG